MNRNKNVISKIIINIINIINNIIFSIIIIVKNIIINIIKSNIIIDIIFN